MWGNYKKYFGWGFICETWYVDYTIDNSIDYIFEHSI